MKVRWRCDETKDKNVERKLWRWKNEDQILRIKSKEHNLKAEGEYEDVKSSKDVERKIWKWQLMMKVCWS